MKLSIFSLKILKVPKKEPSLKTQASNCLKLHFFLLSEPTERENNFQSLFNSLIRIKTLHKNIDSVNLKFFYNFYIL